MDHSVSSFLSGCAIAVPTPSKTLLFAAKQIDQFAEQDQPNSSFFILDNGKWAKYPTNVAWPAIAMAVARPTGQKGVVVAVSPYGDFWEVLPANMTETSGTIGSQALQLRSLSTIENEIYSCGMGRVVLKREAPGQWRPMGPHAPPGDDDAVVGFEGIDGFSGGDIYAVGWAGEMWNLRKDKWHRIDSPVSIKLNAVCCCAEDRNVYAVGDAGVMLRGRGDSWEVLDTERDENLMAVRVHDGTVFVATDFHILRLKGDSLINDDAFADPADLPATCLYLPRAENALYSMGPKDLFQREGGRWKRLV